MKVFLTVAVFAASVSAGFGETCRSEQIDAENILSADCNTGDGKGTFKDSTLDLDHILTFKDGQILSKWAQEPDFGKDCKDCELYRLPDRLWGGAGVNRVWMNCTCASVGKEVAVNLDEQRITNYYGLLSQS